MDPLTTEQLNAVYFIEKYWHQHGSFPSVDKIKINYEESLNNETFVLALINRGIELPNPDGVPGGLSKEQIAAVLTVLDFENKKSRAAKLRDLGISSTKWAGWLKDEKFKKFLHETSTINFHDAIHTAQEGLLRSIDRGDVAAIKYYMELTGRHTSDSATEMNTRVLVARVIEAIQRHVRDPDTLRAIATDFEKIMRGDPVELDSPKMLEVTI